MKKGAILGFVGSDNDNSTKKNNNKILWNKLNESDCVAALQVYQVIFYNFDKRPNWNEFHEFEEERKKKRRKKNSMKLLCICVNPNDDDDYYPGKKFIFFIFSSW